MILGMEGAIDDPCESRVPRGIQYETVIIVW